MKPILLLFLCSLAVNSSAQQKVEIRVNAAITEGALRSSWAYFGHDEPNFTYSQYGKPLIFKLAEITPNSVHVRTHNLLTTGDGTPALKWGSTNVYTEDAAGRPAYDWTILDKIFDTYQAAAITPFVEIGFMPKALSIHPEPYQHNFPKGSIFTGWAYPPRDYSKWAELVHQWVLHSIERYGRGEVEKWDWEVWNEPDIGYWQGTPEEYSKLYDYAVDGVKRALPEAHVGGPGTTNPSSPKAAAFLRQFLEHCLHGKNFATGKTGAPLDFISFHAKGGVKLVDGHVQMDIRRHLGNIAAGFDIVKSFSQLRPLPIVLSESDPEGCAACSVGEHPENAYRNSSQYASYNAAVLKGALELAQRDNVNLQGVLTWAFEFEDQPYFAGFRALTTRDIDLPVLNGFRLLGLMGGERIQSSSSGALSVDSLLTSSARRAPDINVLASRAKDKVTILVWNYQDDDIPTSSAPIDLTVEGFPPASRRILVQRFQVDQEKSNAFTVWREMGSPQEPSTGQHARLVAAGQLQLAEPPSWIASVNGRAQLTVQLPSQSISLIELTW